MSEKRPVLVTSEETKKSPLLIIDKKGVMGASLAKQLQDQFLLVLVSGQDVSGHYNIIHISYRKQVPIIPDNHYSHIFTIYNGEPEVLDMLPSLMKKANDTKGKLLFITSLPYITPELLRQLGHSNYQHMQVLIYGETFQKGGTDDNIVTMFLRQAKRYGRIEIPNEGVGKLYPVLLDDVYDAIIATAFSAHHEHMILVFPKHPISELSIARMLQKQNPLLRLDFSKYKGKAPVYIVPTAGEYYYPEYPLEKKLKEIFSGIVIGEGKRESTKTSNKKKLLFPKKKRQLRLGIFWLILTSILLAPILITIFTAVAGVGVLQVSFREMEKGRILQATSYASLANQLLDVAQKMGKSLFYVDPFVGKQKAIALSQIGIAKELAGTEVDVLDAIGKLSAVADKKSTNPKNDFSEALATVKNALITVQKMRAEGELPPGATAKIEAFSPLLLPLENTIDALPSLLGFEGKREYLVLFQNNMELRPGGGFIGSYGLVRVEKGSVTQFKVYDVYDADGKLTFHIEPPFGLRRYLGASHWFLRDSNFSIDFPQDARQATTFLQYETGEKVDGVIAVDTSFLKNILTAMGSVTVPDYKETVTPDNFYLRTQMHAENDFFPGSTQKKDFLGALLAAMQDRIATRKDVQYQELVGKIGESILGKHLIFVFSDEATQKLFTVNNLSSSLWDGRPKQPETYSDFLGVIDANLGTNKVNYYLTRSIDQKTTILDDGAITTTATVTYKNSSTAKSSFGGDYKNYLRFVVPSNAVLREVKLNGVTQDLTAAVTDPAVYTAKKFVAPKGLEIETTQEQGKGVFGFLLTVPQSTTKNVSVRYETVRAINPRMAAFSYDGWLFKQPGTQDDLYTFSLSYPSAYQVVHAEKSLSDVGGKLVYSSMLSQDQELRAEFSKK